MPYIKKENRKYYDDLINNIVKELSDNYDGESNKTYSVGELNYVISSIIWRLFENNPCYTNGSNLTGVLECVKEEFYRRKMSELENRKMLENGDI